MSSSISLRGQNAEWELIKKIGEGDAGEVFLVRDTSDASWGVLKRPTKGSQLLSQRQAIQIEQEGKILAEIKSVTASCQEYAIRPVKILDLSPKGTENSDQYFIVLERAPGIDLSLFAQVAKTGKFLNSEYTLGIQEIKLLESISAQEYIPDKIFLSVLNCLVAFLETIHHFPIKERGKEKGGLIWNDIKPDHIFWDGLNQQIVLIDWGNTQILEADGVTRDRRFTRSQDYQQLANIVDEYLRRNVSPALQSSLTNQLVGDQNAVSNFTRQLQQLLEIENREISILRNKEADCLEKTAYALDDLEVLYQVHKQLLKSGELPDYPGAFNLGMRMIKAFAEEVDSRTIYRICKWVESLQPTDPEFDLLVSLVGDIAWSVVGAKEFQSILNIWLAKDWASLYMDLSRIAHQYFQNRPPWLEPLTSNVREQRLGYSPDDLTPLKAVCSLENWLQSQRFGLKEKIATEDDESSEAEYVSQLASYLDIIIDLKASIACWSDLEIPTDKSLITYDLLDNYPIISQMDGAVSSFGFDIPEQELQQLRTSFSEVQYHIQNVHKAWMNQNFEAANQALNQLFVLDPERRRLVEAARCIETAGDLIDQARSGPSNPQDGTSIYAFSKGMQQRFEELKIRIGAADWLEPYIKLFSEILGGKELRNTINRKDVFDRMPWIVHKRKELSVFEKGSGDDDLVSQD